MRSRKRSCAPLQEQQRTIPVSPSASWVRCAFTLQSPYCIRSMCRGAPRRRVPLRRPLAARRAAPVGFCLGLPPPSYVLDTRPDRSRAASLPGGRSLPRERRAFLSAQPERSLPTISLRQAFRLQREASMAVDSTACYCPRTSCHHSRSPILSLVTIPLRTATGAGLYVWACDVSRGF